MDEREKLLEAMRRDLRRVASQLAREGWTQEEVAEVSATVREHLAADNQAGLEAMAQWLAGRAWKLLEQEQRKWADARAKERWVSFGPKQEAAIRALNRAWACHRTN